MILVLNLLISLWRRNRRQQRRLKRSLKRTQLLHLMKKRLTAKIRKTLSLRRKLMKRIPARREQLNQRQTKVSKRKQRNLRLRLSRQMEVVPSPLPTEQNHLHLLKMGMRRNPPFPCKNGLESLLRWQRNAESREKKRKTQAQRNLRIKRRRVRTERPLLSMCWIVKEEELRLLTTMQKKWIANFLITVKHS